MFAQGVAELMIDTGSDLNLVKENAVDPRAWINRRKIYNLTGIGSGMYKIMGEIKVFINGAETYFQIVQKDFPIKQQGILGMQFLKGNKAILNFEHGKLEFNDISLPFLEYHTIHLPARTKKLVKISASDTQLRDGYLARIQAGPGIFLGESLVRQEGGCVKTFAINTNPHDVDLIIAPVELEPCQVVPPRARGISVPHPSSETRTTKAKRLGRLLGTLNLSDLSEQEKQSLLPLLSDHSSQFHLPGDSLGATTVLSHKIVTTDENPINSKQYRFPPIHRDEIRKQVDELIQKGLVQASESPYNSPLWIVPKKPDSTGNKRWRLVIDYRQLNEKTIGDAYPLPNITDILDQLGGSKYFSILDLASGFHQIPMDPSSKAKTAFSTPYAHLEFNRMPFGLKNAPATFQRLMDRVLSGLQGIELFVYMDDIVIYATSLEEHALKLKKLLARLKAAGLALQPDKCQFLRRDITYLGHIITEKGVLPDPRKLEAVRNFPVPQRKRNIKQFLGLIGYYRRFIPDFAKISKPLTQLLKKHLKFFWGPEQQKSFEILRDKLCSQPLLQYPDFKRPFIVTTDASDFAIGAILSQGQIGRDLPIAYASRTLNQAETNYSTTEKELLAIVFAVKHFRPYLYGHKFTLVTDHRPLIWLNGLKDPVSRLARWKIKLSEYDYDIVYKKGTANSNADALSRNPPNLNDFDEEIVESTQAGKILSIDAQKSAQSALNFMRDETDITEEEDWDCNDASTRNDVIDQMIVNVFLTSGELEKENKNQGLGNDSDNEVWETASESEGENETLAGYQRPRVSHKTLSCRKSILGTPLSPTLEVKFAGEVEGTRHWNPGAIEKTQEPRGHTEGEARSPHGGRFDPKMCLPDDNGSTISSGAPCDRELRSQGPQVQRALASHPPHTLSGERGESAGEGTLKGGTGKGQSEDTERLKEKLGKGCQKGNLKRKELEIETAIGFGDAPLIGNVYIIEDSCIITVKDTLILGTGHKINFISADCMLTTAVSKELEKAGLIKAEKLKEANPQLGQVIIYAENNRYTFNLVIKNTYEERPFLKHVAEAIYALKETMELLEVKKADVSKTGNGLDRITWPLIEQTFRQAFGESDMKIRICTGQIQFPSVEERPKIIREYHESVVGGHKGVTKTYKRIRDDFFWDGMKQEITDFVTSCKDCQINKLVRVKTRLPMKITDTPTEPFERIQIDIVGPLPVTERKNRYILTIQDNFSKYCEAIALKEIDSVTIAHAFAEEFITRFGCPRIIHTDQGSNFTSKIFRTICKIFRIEKLESSAIYPQSLGSLERSHHSLVEYLKEFGTDQNWDSWLRFAIFSYNTSVHEATGYAPHTLVFGKEANIPSSFARGESELTYIQYLDNFLKRLSETQSTAAQRLLAAKWKSKRYYDQKLNIKSFRVGDHVLLLKEPRSSKFDPQYTGHYVISRLLGDTNAEIQLSSDKTKIVHLNKLKLFTLPVNRNTP